MDIYWYLTVHISGLYTTPLSRTIFLDQLFAVLRQQFFAILSGSARTMISFSVVVLKESICFVLFFKYICFVLFFKYTLPEIKEHPSKRDADLCVLPSNERGHIVM
jgi:hypothetical protein